jgi:hypothetical protein
MAKQEFDKPQKQIPAPPSEGSSTPDEGQSEPRRDKQRSRSLFPIQLIGLVATLAGMVAYVPHFYNASREGNASGVLVASIGILMTTLSAIGFAAAPEFRDLSKQTWQWLRARAKTAIYSAFSGIGVVGAVWVLLERHNIALAGFVVIAAAAVRLVAARSVFRDWKKPLEQLRLHVATEVFFHCFALWGLTAGLLLEVAAVESLDTGPRMTITITLSLALLVAVNKATGRTRKLCTAIDGKISEVIRAVEALRADAASERTNELRREALEGVDTLDRMLRTQLNTGYKLTGTSIIPKSTRDNLIRGVRAFIISDLTTEGDWPRSKFSLQNIQNVCGRWTDTMA